MKNRLDYTCHYTECPGPPSELFPAPTWHPILDVQLSYQSRSLRVLAVPDTGAGMTLFHSDLAEALNIDWRSGLSTPIHGISSQVTGYATPVKISLCDANYSWESPVTFSDGVTRATALLGHLGFFEHFEVRFKTRQKQFRIFLK